MYISVAFLNYLHTMSQLFIIAICCIIHRAISISIDNEVMGTPKVDCEDTVLSLSFNTKRAFTGRVYVRGLADDDRCSRTFVQNSEDTNFTMAVKHGDCAMQRQRVAGSLEGIMFSLTIVVSFHGTFVTKVDRAYRCLCFFRNIKHLTSAIDMSAIGTTELVNTAKMPTCTYTIHAQGPDGPPVTFGQVGEQIYHVWECDDDSHGFLVHSCFVNDGRGTQFDLMDVDGCPIDPIIQPEVTYDDDLQRAVVETWGYKFSDTSVLNYQCVVELCKKETGECEGLTPPSCGRTKRDTLGARRRFHRRALVSPDNVMDLIASVSVLDTINEDGIRDSKAGKMAIEIKPERSFRPRPGIAIMPVSRTCLSTLTMGVFAVTVFLSFVISAVVTTILLARNQRSGKI